VLSQLASVSVPTLRTRLDRAALLAMMRLPAPVVRRLAGPPVVIDGQTLAPDVQLALRVQALTQSGLETMPVERARAGMRETTWTTSGELPIGSTRSFALEGLPARLYVPRAGSDALLVYFHGGGFFVGDLETHEGTCRFLAERAGVRVLSVEYRQGPEHPFPAAHDDALSAYRWVVEHLPSLGVAPGRVGVGGDSAGGNLAANVALEAARTGLPCVVQALVYPATQREHTLPSATHFAEGFYLNSEWLRLAVSRYGYAAPDGEPRLDLLAASVPPGVAPALVFTAGFDPLRDEGEAYAEKLRAAGVPVTVQRFKDQIHGFVNVVDAMPSSRAANEAVASAVAAAFGVPG
jgi:acetyl esterase